MSGPSMPCGGCIISSIGKLCCCTSISTSRSSSCPSFSWARNFSRVRRRRSLASVSASGSLDSTSPLEDTTKSGRPLLCSEPPELPEPPPTGGGGTWGSGGSSRSKKNFFPPCPAARDNPPSPFHPPPFIDTPPHSRPPHSPSPPPSPPPADVHRPAPRN